MYYAKDDCQGMAHYDSNIAQHTLHDSNKSVFLRLEKHLHLTSTREGGGSNGSAQKFDSLPDEDNIYMKDMENQIRLPRGENYELKRDISHLYSLVQATHSEVRSCSSKVNEKVAILAKKY